MKKIVLIIGFIFICNILWAQTKEKQQIKQEPQNLRIQKIENNNGLKVYKKTENKRVSIIKNSTNSIAEKPKNVRVEKKKK